MSERFGRISIKSVLSIEANVRWKVLVLGSLGTELIRTPFVTSPIISGGTAFYGAEALLKAGGIKPIIVSAIGHDLDSGWIANSFSGSIDIRGITKDLRFPSFFWEARYSEGCGSVETLNLENRLYDTFNPDWESLIDIIKCLKYSYLGAFNPRVQFDCCVRLRSSFILTETLSYWIEKDRNSVLAAFANSDAIVVTEHEFAQLWGDKLVPPCSHRAAENLITDLGLRFLVVTFAERGAQVFEKDCSFYVPAMDCFAVDSTGAGNVFSGGLIGYLARFGTYDRRHLLNAAVFGTILAGAQVRGFGSSGLRALETREIAAQQKRLSELIIYS